MRWLLLWVVSASACAGMDTPRDAGADATLAFDAGPDAGKTDAGAIDADAGMTDAGMTMTDAGMTMTDAGMTVNDAGTTNEDAGSSCPCPRSVGCAAEGDIVCAPAPEYPCSSADGWYAVCTPTGWECRFTMPAIC